MPTKFADEIFVTKENEGTKDEFSEVHSTTKNTAVIGETKLVARYKLVETLKVTGTVEIQRPKKK